MSRFCGVILVFALLHSLVSPAAAQEIPLSVISSGPEGEISDLSQANEVRVVFSEPMVALGKVPKNQRPPWFSIAPNIAGVYRWSGTTTLIFTPDPKKKLPFATRYDVKVEAGAQSIAGKKLAGAHTFSFTTPTLKLLSTNWYRKTKAPDAPLVFGLRFNQPVDRAALAPHVHFGLIPHELSLPTLQPAAKQHLLKIDPNAVVDFEAKLTQLRAAARASANVLGFVPPSWDVKQLGKGDDLFVFETRPGITGSHAVRVRVDGKAPSKQGKERPLTAQEFTAEIAPALYVRQISCTAGCDPESWIAVRLSTEVDMKQLRNAATVYDITDGKLEKLTPQRPVNEESEFDPSNFSIEDLGHSILPARTYLITLDKSLRSTGGESLGHLWGGVIEYLHKRAFSSFGEGHGVWEADGGTQLPFYARNLRSVRQWAAPLRADELMPTILKNRDAGFRIAPATKPVTRALTPTADKIQSFGVDIGAALRPNARGLLWAAIEEGKPIARSHLAGDGAPRSTIIQVTNLGLTVKDSPQNTLIFVTRLDTGAPVAGVNVAIRNTANQEVWRGVTDARGIALAGRTPLRANSWELSFIVTAEKDGDVAYVGSDWNDGIEPWMFNVNFDLEEQQSMLRGSIFADRGVYKLGEEIHLKMILRQDTPTGMKLYPRGTKVKIVATDSHSGEIDSRTVILNDWSAADWTMRVPADAPLGDYSVAASIDGEKHEIFGSFLVAAYRRPDFRVDVKLQSQDDVAGAKLTGTVNAKYLFGAAMADREVKWTYSKTRIGSVPDAVSDRFGWDRWAFLGDEWARHVTGEPYANYSRTTLAQNSATTTSEGALVRELDTDLTAGHPYQYELEATVTDVSRQRISGRSSFAVHPAPWYIGVKRPPFFVSAKDGVATELVAVTPEGAATAGVSVKVELKKIQWHSVRRAEGNGFYTWESEKKEVDAGTWTTTTRQAPVPLQIPIKHGGGYYVMRATAADAQGRRTETSTSFYATGDGYTAWERYDHNRIDLIPERATYKPGETARLIVKSPWESATALLTVEREGIRSHRQFTLDSTQQTVSVPIGAEDIPNIYVSIVLVKGRTQQPTVDDSSDPGKPAFRIGYAELKVEDATKKLIVDVKASKEEFRPATKAKVSVAVRDLAGKPAKSEVTLWAVDYGVLSLTGFEPPDVVDAVWIEKALQVMNQDSRQRIISRRVTTPKGATEGGGGGKDFGNVRKDFRVLAFWVGSLVTDDRGEAATEVTLPESLTTYRIMAVAQDRQSRFGSGSREIRTNKPLLLKPAYPRFMTIGDEATFGSIVHNQGSASGNATVVVRSLDPELLEVVGETRRSIAVKANAPQEVRYVLRARAAGTARLQMSVTMGRENDAFEDVIPIRFIATPETVAAYGVATPDAKEVVQLPAGVITNYGGLRVSLASTALVGLSEGAKYLVDYPYGCSEQRASAALGVMLAADLGGAFNIPGLKQEELRPVAQATIKKLETFQCGDGGFAYWAGECHTTSPYLTSYIVHVLQRGQALKYAVNNDVLARAYDYLEGELALPKPSNEGWWPSYLAWQAFSVKVLTQGQRNQDSNINRLMERLDRVPVFALAYLHDAVVAKGEAESAAAKELRRRMKNAIATEAGASHVQELSDPYLLFVWSSNVRSTGIVLGSLVRAGGEPAVIRSLVRGLLDARRNGRWGNTQENAVALEALVDYYRKYERESPSFRADVKLGDAPIFDAEFRQRNTVERSSDVPMQQLLRRAASGTELPLTFHKEGPGTLFYNARLTYASSALTLAAMENGMVIERVYTPLGTSAGPVPVTSYKSGDTVRVTLTVRLSKERTFVAINDPLPAGFEPVETRFATTGRAEADAASDSSFEHEEHDWTWGWRAGGFDHIERHDDKVRLFATRLGAGVHTYSYTARATTSGTFRVAPTRIEQMYRPEVWGRSESLVVKVE